MPKISILTRRTEHAMRWPKMRLVLGAVLIGLCVALPVAAQGPRLDQLTDREMVRVWLLTNCGLGHVERIEGELLRRGILLQPLLLEALRDGPDRELTLEVERAAVERFDDRRAFLESPTARELDTGVLEEMRRVRREAFVTDEIERFRDGYRSAAVAGLGLAGGTDARPELQRIAADRASPLRTAAEQALQQLDKR